MNDLAFLLLPIAAIGYSLIYLLCGGGIGGGRGDFYHREDAPQMT